MLNVFARFLLNYSRGVTLACLLAGYFLCADSYAEGRVGSSLAARDVISRNNESEQIAEYRRQVKSALAATPSVLRLAGKIDPSHREAQELAFTDPRFLDGLRDGARNVVLRSEIMGIYALRDSDMVTPETQVCKTTSRCFRVEQFLFASNDTRIAIVDITRTQVLSVRTLLGIQPEISPRLQRVALELAAASPIVSKALGRAPTLDEFVMANTKTALNKTSCERSQHLCVAPTIVEGKTALFVIVDLTDLRVVGARWTKLGRAATAPSERRVQNETIARDYCDRATPVDRNGWKFNFQITSSDGVRVADVEYKGRKLYRSVKTVDWHVAYSWKDGMGYSDAVGCPVFSQAAVVAIDEPTFEAITENGKDVGFRLIQDFRSDQWPRPCNYYYRQRFDFYNDGSFRPVAASFGRGCGDDGHYRPVTRIEFFDMTQVAQWQGGWKAWLTEDWKLARELGAAPDQVKLRFRDAKDFSIEVRPNEGGLAQSRGDNAYLYVTIHPAGRDEGASDLPPIGTCCNKDHRQGPQKFMSPKEPIAENNPSPLVLWYVAQLKNDARSGQEYCWADFAIEAGVYVPKAYPCYSGPLLLLRQSK